MSLNIIYLFITIFENDAKLEFPHDFTFFQSLLVDYLKTMNMDLTPFATTVVKLRPKHTKKKLRFYFVFILVRTTTKSIQFIKKPVFLF
jgi:hypothetical protein